jgi:hypothetical protein
MLCTLSYLLLHYGLQSIAQPKLSMPFGSFVFVHNCICNKVFLWEMATLAKSIINVVLLNMLVQLVCQNNCVKGIVHLKP